MLARGACGTRPFGYFADLCGNVGNQSIYGHPRFQHVPTLKWPYRNFSMNIPLQRFLPCHADANRPSDPQVQWLGALDEAFQICGGKDTL